MNCTQTEESLTLHLAGELEDDGEFLSHLALCDVCARRAEMSQMVWDLAGLAPEGRVPGAAVQGVYEAIDRFRRRPRRLYFTLLRLGTVAAAATLILSWLAPGAPPPGRPEAELCQAPPELMDQAGFGRIEVAEGPLGLKSHAVTVTVDDWTMRTEVEEVFFNASDRRLEGTFHFPLPPDASLSRFAMEVEGKLVEGELVERVRAREVYEGIVRRMQDPALLEWMPGNVFKARIFPIEPWSPKRVILAYSQAPRMWNGALQYVYPLVSEKTKEHPPESLAVRAEFRFARPIERLECPTHRADVARRDARSARVELALRNARPEENFHVRVELAPEEIAVAAHRPPGEDGVLGVAFAPRLPEAEAPPGSFVFVVDRSARMGEAELEIARRVVERMAARLSPADRVGIVAHHIGTSAARADFATEERREEWGRFLRDLRGEGASDVLGALRAAAGLAPAGATVIYVGKGVPTWGEADAGKVASEAAAALKGRVFRAVLVGTGANEAAMSMIAGVRDGAVQSIVPGGDTEAEVAAVARTVAVRPVQDLRLEVEGAEVREVMPSKLPALFPGERVFLFARYAAGESPRRAKVTVRGFSGGRRVERTVEVDLPSGPTEHGPLFRLWAQRALAERVAECQARGEPAEAVAAIVELSRRHQLMTPYTSFLVLESEEAYKQYQIERAKRREEERRQEEEQKDRRAGADAGALTPDLAYKREVLRKMAHLLELSYLAFDQKRFDRCIKLCDELLVIDPHYAVAKELKEDAQKSRHKDEYHALFARKVEEWRKLTRDDAQAAVPWSSTVRFPERSEWAEISRRISQAVIRTEGGSDEDPMLLARGRTAQEQTRVTESQDHYQLALRHHHKGESEKAAIEARRAVEAWPENLAARKLYNDIQQLIVGGRAESGARPLTDQAVTDFRVRFDQGQLEITKHVRNAERYSQARMYDEALRELQSAEFKIESIPYEVKAMNELLPRVRDAAVRARNARTLEERRVEEEKGRFSEAESAAAPPGPQAADDPSRYMREALVRHQQTGIEMDNAYAAGLRAFNTGEYEQAGRQFRRILEYAKWMPTGVELETRRRQAADMLARTRAERGPADVLGFPDGEEWKELLSKRRPRGIADMDEAGSVLEDPEILTINRKLDSMKIDLAFENTKLEDILAFVRDYSGLNIVVDAAVQANVDPQKGVTFKGTDLTVGKSLQLLASRFGLDYRVTDEKVVLLTDPKKAASGRLRGEDREILDKLKSIRITIDMKDAPLTAVVDYVREISGLNIHIVGIENPDRERVSLCIQDAALDGALRMLLEPRGMAYAVRDGLVLILRAPKVDEAVAGRIDVERGIREMRAKMRLER